jgi:hypothetical protein
MAPDTPTSLNPGPAAATDNMGFKLPPCLIPLQAT